MSGYGIPVPSAGENAEYVDLALRKMVEVVAALETATQYKSPGTDALNRDTEKLLARAQALQARIAAVQGRWQRLQEHRDAEDARRAEASFAEYGYEDNE